MKPESANDQQKSRINVEEYRIERREEKQTHKKEITN